MHADNMKKGANIKMQSNHGDFQFLNVSGPDQFSSEASRKLARTHVAKATHAKVRRRRMTLYNAAKNKESNQRSAWYTGYDIRGFHTEVAPGGENEGGDDPASIDTLARGYSLTGILRYGRMDPFDSFSRCVSPSEHRLFDHYIRTVVPLETLHSHCFTDPETYSQNITVHWVPIAISDPGMLNGLFLFACRSLHFLTGDASYYTLALQYKLNCLRWLNEAVSGSASAAHINDTTIARALQLASDELSTGNKAICKIHMDAVVNMVHSNGGLQRINGMNGFLRQMVSVFACREQWEDIINAASGAARKPPSS